MMDTIHSISERFELWRDDPDYIEARRVGEERARKSHGLEPAITYQYEVETNQFHVRYAYLDRHWQRAFFDRGLAGLGGTKAEKEGTVWYWGRCETCDRKLVVSIDLAKVGVGVSMDGVGFSCGDCFFAKNPLIDPRAFYPEGT